MKVRAEQTAEAGQGQGGDGGQPAAPRAALRVPHAPDARLPAQSDRALLRFHHCGAGDDAPTDALCSPFAGDSDGDSEAGLAALLARHVAATQQARGGAVGRQRDALGRALSQLRDLLAADADAARDPETLRRALDGPSGGHIDVSGLLARLPSPRGSLHIGDADRARMTELVDTLATALSGLDAPHVAVLATAEREAQLGELPPSVPGRVCEAPIAEAMAELRQAERHALLTARALRAAHLQLSHGYDPALHDAVLADLSLDELDADERLAMPVRVVLADDAALGAELPALLGSDLPLHALVPLEPWSTDGADATDPGTRAVALAETHARCVLVQTGPLSPAHLEATLQQMAAAVGPAVGRLAIGPTTGDAALAALSLRSRAYPLYDYDPDRPVAQRLSLEANADWARPWATMTLTCEDAAGLQHGLEVAVTPADLAAQSPAARAELRVIGGDAWASDQLPVDAFLRAWDEGSLQGQLPYVWVVTEGMQLQRAIVSRRLVSRVRASARAYRALLERAGVDNPWFDAGVEAGRGAAEAAHAEAMAAAASAHAEALVNAEAVGARVAVERIVGVLLGDLEARDGAATETGTEAETGAETGTGTGTGTETGTGTGAGAGAEAETETGAGTGTGTGAGAGAGTGTGTGAGAEVEVAAEGVAEEDDFGADEAFIDTTRCTTCNECTARFPAVFEYDDNKQARFVEGAALPFAALVAAAEKCPARCIFPGAPRDDDDTVDDALLARARELA